MNCLEVLARRNYCNLGVALFKTAVRGGGERCGCRRTQSFPLKSTSRTTFWWLVYTLNRVRTIVLETETGERHVYGETSSDMLPLHGSGLLTSSLVATARFPVQIGPRKEDEEEGVRAREKEG